MGEPFSVEMRVRGYETDAQGHLNTAVYLQYAEHARWEILRVAGIRQADLIADGIGPVNLETTIRFRKELRAGDAVLVSCAFVWGTGKTFQVEQQFTTPEGELVAEVTGVGGLMDLTARRLVAEPGERFRVLAADPGLLGL
ncbi:acyl-CoA thioesterase [Actinoplanes sp. TBRC 11911]|uniref:acyl-CoA thioesterase n=1 Tax=Actinoplanes sp. TBRC 11911 TaxID=2729386 RepID=UPI00145C9BB9|nr:acyl-CoA thioesterase [Actinoplanes sp. TBRC 11911]NMO51843.1 acyl-CoA thioesterase [Actinoplanes sp. TBRC 11911]